MSAGRFAGVVLPDGLMGRGDVRGWVNAAVGGAGSGSKLPEVDLDDGG